MLFINVSTTNLLLFATLLTAAVYNESVQVRENLQVHGINARFLYRYKVCPMIRDAFPYVVPRQKKGQPSSHPPGLVCA